MRLRGRLRGRREGLHLTRFGRVSLAPAQKLSVPLPQKLELLTEQQASSRPRSTSQGPTA